MTWPLFFTAFSFIFLAALPGRTTFLMLLMAARTPHPWGIFWGAAVAFTCQSIISVALGSVLAFFPPHWIHFAAGVLFLFFAFLFWRDGRLRRSELPERTPKKNSSPFEIIRGSFLVIFMAEWGDVSQVAIASFSARYSQHLEIFFSAIVALWVIAAVAVFIGSRARKVVKSFLIQRIASVVFALTGIYLIGVSLGFFA